jgi:hypothetical protein
MVRNGNGCGNLQEYDIKRGHYKNIEGEKLKILIESTFGKVDIEDNKYSVYYGALQPLTTWLEGNNVLCIETTMKKDVSDDEINETIRRYNKFLESATGFNSKERVKRSKKKSEGK